MRIRGKKALVLRQTNTAELLDCEEVMSVFNIKPGVLVGGEWYLFCSTLSTGSKRIQGSLLSYKHVMFEAKSIRRVCSFPHTKELPP